MVKGRKELLLLLEAEKERSIPSGPTERPGKVRLAGEADENAAFDLLMMNLQENAASIAPIDPEKVAHYILMGTRKKGGMLGLIDGPDGKPVAMVLLVYAQWWWSKAWFIQDQVMYVHPDHRRSNHIDDLQKFAKWAVDAWTQDFGYRVYLLTGVLGTKRVREKIVLFRRRFATVVIACLYPAPPTEN